MKLSFMTFACPEWTIPQVLDAARRYGYDGVEPRTDSGHHHGIEVGASAASRGEIRAQFEDAGVEVACVATSLCLARSGTKGLEQCAAALPLLDLAADLGAPGLRVFGGQPLTDDENAGPVSREDATRWAADNLRSVAGEAASRGVHLWFETHDFFVLGRDAAAVIKLADHPAVRCNWDVMHPQVNGEEFAVTKGYLNGLIEHTHVHDAKTADANTICPFGEGVLPLVDMLRWLRDDQQFTGFLSAEYFGDSLGATPDVSLEVWARGCREVLSGL